MMMAVGRIDGALRTGMVFMVFHLLSCGRDRHRHGTSPPFGMSAGSTGRSRGVGRVGWWVMGGRVGARNADSRDEELLPGLSWSARDDRRPVRVQGVDHVDVVEPPGADPSAAGGNAGAGHLR